MSSDRKGNGEFLRCVQELEASVPPELAPLWRKVAVHIVSLEQDIQRIKDDHTNPDTGQPYDVRRAYRTVDELTVLMGDVRRALNWAQAGVWIVGILGPIIMALCVYIWLQTERQVKENTRVNQELARAQERIAGALNVLSVRLDHQEEDEAKQHGRR